VLSARAVLPPSAPRSGPSPAKVSVTFVVKEGPKVSVGKITLSATHVSSEFFAANEEPEAIDTHSIFLENLLPRPMTQQAR
jgi:hypothetical protein